VSRTSCGPFLLARLQQPSDEGADLFLSKHRPGSGGPNRDDRMTGGLCRCHRYLPGRTSTVMLVCPWWHDSYGATSVSGPGHPSRGLGAPG